MNGNSLILPDAQMDAHYDGPPQCHHCAEDMSDEDVEIEKEMGDSLCDSCRASIQEPYEL